MQLLHQETVPPSNSWVTLAVARLPGERQHSENYSSPTVVFKMVVGNTHLTRF